MSVGGRGYPYLPQSERCWAWAQHSQWAYSLVTTRYRSPNMRHDRTGRGMVSIDRPVLTCDEHGVWISPINTDNLHLARAEELMRVLYSPWPKSTLRQVHGVVLKSFWPIMAGMDTTRRGIAGPRFPEAGYLTWGWRVVDYRWVRDKVVSANPHRTYTLDMMLAYHEAQPPDERTKYRYKTLSNLTKLWGLLYASGM